MTFFLLILGWLSSPIFAYDTIDQYKSDYLYQRSTYQKNYANYQEKSQINQKFSSVSTQKDLFDSATQVSQNRNLTLRTYLTLLRIQLSQYQDQHPDITSNLQKQLADHESWLDNQNQQILSSVQTSQLNDINLQFKQTYPQIQQTLYAALVQIQINLQSKILNLLNQLQKNIQQTNSDIDPQWFTEIENQTKLVPQQLQKTYELTQKKQYNNFNNFYPTAQKELQTSQNNLLQIQTNLKTIISKFL